MLLPLPHRRLPTAGLFELPPGLYVTNHMLEGYDTYEELGPCTNHCFFCCDEHKEYPGTDAASFIKQNPGDNDRIFLCGREPTGLPELFDRLRFLSSRYRVVSIATNGIRLGSQDFTRRLAKAGVGELFFSLHGHRAAIHDRVTQAEGSFDDSLAGIGNALSMADDGSANWRIAVNSVLTKSSIEHLVPFLRFLIELGIPAVCFSTLLPLGLGDSAFDSEILPYGEMIEAVQRARHALEQELTELPLRVFLLHVPFCAAPPRHGSSVSYLLTRTPGEFGSLVGPASRAHCTGCPLTDYCEGVFDAYGKRFGYDEFHFRAMGHHRHPDIPADDRTCTMGAILAESEAVFCTSVDGKLGEIPDDFSHLSYFRPDRALQYRFLFYYDIAEFLQYSRLLTESSMLIRCGDIECINAIMPLYYFFYGFMPVFNGYRNLHPFSPQLQSKLHFDNVDSDNADALLRPLLAVSTALEVTDGHVVFGPEEMIEGALNALLKESFSPCIFSHSCINKVIGTDMEGIISRVAGQNQTKIVHDCNIGIDQFHEEVARTYDEYVRENSATAEKLPRSVNLVGFAQDRSLDELAACLELCGVQLNEVSVPDVDRERLARLTRAELQVLCPVDGYERIYERLFRRLDIPCIMPPAPYGIEATSRWLAAVGERFGITWPDEEAWQTYLAERDQRRQSLHERAQCNRIGLILAPADIEVLARPSFFFHAIPVLPLLEEMGFALDLLVTRSPSPDRSRAKLESLLRDPSCHTIKFASSLRETRSWLREEACGCVYSDLKNDQRIINSGKACFSLFLFEKGVDGFLRSQERLINLCETSFYDDYKDFRASAARPVDAG